MTTGPSQQMNPPRPPRSRARRLVPLAIAAWVVLEIWLLTLVAQAAGGLVLFLLLLAGIVVGGAVVRYAGRRAWRNLAGQLRAENGPAAAPQSRGNGVLMLGGVLLIVPGVLSDVIGLVLLLPPVRTVLGNRFDRALVGRAMRAPGPVRAGFRPPGRDGQDDRVIRGEVVREDRDEDRGQRQDGRGQGQDRGGEPGRGEIDGRNRPGPGPSDER